MISKMPNGEAEIYLAVQGEGKTIGKPMVFTRLANCNLMCKWCDTFYTWNFDNLNRPNPHSTELPVKKEDYVKEMSEMEVMEKIKEQKVKAVNFTGGEPTLQQTSILNIMRQLRLQEDGWWFETETNGTIKMQQEYLDSLDQINCSPKLESSGNLEPVRHRPEVIQQIKSKAIFKFVVTTDWREDIEEIKNWQKQNKVPSEKIYLMPEGIEKEKIIQGTRFLMDTFAKEGFNISTRLQVICYGAKRAV